VFDWEVGIMTGSVSEPRTIGLMVNPKYPLVLFRLYSSATRPPHVHILLTRKVSAKFTKPQFLY